MYNRESKIGKQVLAWALVFALTLSVVPYSSADGETEEWFEDWYYDFEDRDEDNNSDLITIHVDPDTNSTNEVEVYIDWSVYNNTGDYIYGDGDSFDINGNETEYFDFEWGLEDCYYEDDACNAGPYTFDFTLYDDEWYEEDYFSISNITLSEVGMPNDVIQIDGGPLAWDDDGLHNDAVARALVLDYEVANVSYELERYVQGLWIDAGNSTTDDEGFAVIYNLTDGEYRWTAYYENEEIDDGWFLLQANSASNIGHVGYFYDLDDDDDFDDFAFFIEEDNETNALSYVEIFYEDNNTLYKSDSADDGNDEEEIIFYDVPEGNYTFDFYYEEDGDLLQSGWLHSYGSETDHVYYWFETHNYTTEDSNNDGVINNVTISYNPDTSSQEEEDIRVEINVYDDDYNGDYHSYEYEITGNETDDFETDVITVEKDGNYTFEVWLYDDDWYDHDSFSFELYLECDEDFTECDSDEWFEDWDYETEDTDGDNLEDTIDISYDPNTDCDCELEVEVDVSVYENGTGDWIDGEYNYHNINGTEEEYFELSWTAHDSNSYDFYVYLYDEDWNMEDSFWIYNVDLYQTSGAGGPGDEDEYFDWIEAYTYDDDGDGYDDTAEIDYDPDTTCECDINITFVIDVYDNETGYWVNGTEEDYTIYSDDDDYWYQEWSPEYNGTFDFYVELYDEDGNLEDEEEYMNISLHVRSSGGGGDDDYDEYFYDWDYDVDPSDKITIGYDPDTECDCEMEIYVYIDVYENSTGDYVDYVYANHTINNGYSDWFTQDWTSWNDDYYDFNVYMYDEDYNFEDEFWIYDVYLSSDDGGGGNQTDDDNGVGHVGIIDNWDEDDYVNDYIGGVLEDGDYKENAYFEIYDDNWNLVDSGNPNFYDMLFVSSNLTEGWYYEIVYYEENGDKELQSGYFYSYGNSTEFEVVNVDNIVVDDDEYTVYDDVGFNAHEGNFDNGVEGVEIDIYKYNEEEDEYQYHDSVQTNETGEAWLYNEDCGEYIWSPNLDNDEQGYYQVWAGCDSTGGGGGGDEDYDEYFYAWDHYIDPSDTITIGYDPDTDCDCDIEIEVYIDVFDNNTGDYIDSIYAEHTIYNGEEDWFEQDWTSYYDATYDFYVYMYDQEYGHDEDEFWIYDVYLSSDGGGSGGDDNGVGHAGYIYDWEDDGNVNDYIGFVMIDDYFKEDAYFEIYQDGELVDSGHAVNEIFVSDNLPEGWYEHVVYYEENGPDLQNGPFYSYGNSTEFEVVNVDNGVFDDDEDTVYDDVGFIAHQGIMDNGVEGVEIAVYVWNDDEEAWYDHAYLVTNETGEATLHNETCGEYEWEVYNDGIDEKGYYEVWAGCDDNGGGDDDYDEWFAEWDYWGKNDENDENIWHDLVVAYDPNTDCNCEMNIMVEMYVENDDGSWSDHSYFDYTINGDEWDWFEIELSVDDPGKYNFYFTLYDDEGNHEDSFEFSLIMSDEWFDDVWSEDDTTVMVDLYPGTAYDGEIYTTYDFYVEMYNEENDYWEWLEYYSDDAWISGSNGGEIHFEWTTNESGQYRFMAVMFDEYGNIESIVDYETWLSTNEAPRVDELVLWEDLYEGNMYKIEALVWDDGDYSDLVISWDMGDGKFYDNAGENVLHMYLDNGWYEITIIVNDGDTITEETFEVEVFNVAPTIDDVMFDKLGNEGDTVSFNAIVSDVGNLDNVVVTWTFPDGSIVDSSFAQYTFTDDGEFVVVVTASDGDDETTEQIMVTVANVAPIITEWVMPSTGQEGEALDFSVGASDPGDDTIVYNVDFGDGTSPLTTQDGSNITHKFAEGDTFTIKICATDEDGGETCREQVLPVSILEQLEDGGLPGFNLLAVISALGVISILRRRTH